MIGNPKLSEVHRNVLDWADEQVERKSREVVDGSGAAWSIISPCGQHHYRLIRTTRQWEGDLVSYWFWTLSLKGGGEIYISGTETGFRIAVSRELYRREKDTRRIISHDTPDNYGNW